MKDFQKVRIRINTFLDPSTGNMSQAASEEKRILNNIPSKKTNIEEKKNTANQRAINFEQKKNKQDNTGPRQFQIGDDRDNDPTEGFESVEGENDDEKNKIKENRKNAKQAFKSKVEDYNQNKEPVNKTKTFNQSEKNRINPREFVIGDSASQAVDDDFAEKERPDYEDSSDPKQEKSVQLQSETEPQDDDKVSESSGVARTHTTEAINPDQIKFKDDLSKYDENDFSNNSQSNWAKGINKDIKRKKKLEKRFEKQHDTKLNQDLDVHSEQSVRLGEPKKRPKTAYKEKVSYYSVIL